MPQDGRHLGASAAVPHLRARRLLRRIEEQARHQALSRDEAPDHHLARTGRELELVLRRRARHGAEMSAEPYQSPTLVARRAQMFPVLGDEEIARLRRFGAARRYADGECLFETGKTSPGMFVVLSGRVRITGRDGHGHDLLIAELSAGRFSGEVGQLSGRRALADGVAAGAVEALLVVPEQLRALLVAEADLGEEIMRALILRRVGLIEMGAGGPVLIGAPSSPDMARLRNFLARNGIPHLVFDPANDPDARGFIERYAPRPEDMPLVACPDGSVLRNPGENELARCIGMLDAADAERVHDVADMVYDVAVVGA